MRRDGLGTDEDVQHPDHSSVELLLPSATGWDAPGASAGRWTRRLHRWSAIAARGQPPWRLGPERRGARAELGRVASAEEHPHRTALEAQARRHPKQLEEVRGTAVDEARSKELEALGYVE